MSSMIRKMPGVLGRIFAGLLLTTRAMGDVVLDFEEIAPLVAANNVPDPQLRLAGAIILLFAGSLSILVVGYIVDSTRPDVEPSR